MLHNVYFWLKKDLSAADRATFERELKLVPAIPYLARGFAGKPAPTPARPVTDQSFDYSLCLEFKTLADHDHYQAGCEHHQRFVDTCKSFWERVVVYDSTSLG